MWSIIILTLFFFTSVLLLFLILSIISQMKFKLKIALFSVQCVFVCCCWNACGKFEAREQTTNLWICILFKMRFFESVVYLVVFCFFVFCFLFKRCLHCSMLPSFCSHYILTHTNRLMILSYSRKLPFNLYSFCTHINTYFIIYTGVWLCVIVFVILLYIVNNSTPPSYTNIRFINNNNIQSSNWSLSMMCLITGIFAFIQIGFRLVYL